MSRYARQDDDAEIDLTSMLDVVFIILIFFIVTASFLKESGIAISRPDSTKEPLTEDLSVQNIVFQVNADNEIWMDERRVDVRSVRAVIERRFAEQPNAAVVINAHPQSTASAYTQIADAARAAGNYRVTMITTKE